MDVEFGGAKREIMRGSRGRERQEKKKKDTGGQFSTRSCGKVRGK